MPRHCPGRPPPDNQVLGVEQSRLAAEPSSNGGTAHASRGLVELHGGPAQAPRASAFFYSSVKELCIASSSAIEASRPIDPAKA